MLILMPVRVDVAPRINSYLVIFTAKLAGIFQGQQQLQPHNVTNHLDKYAMVGSPLLVNVCNTKANRPKS